MLSFPYYILYGLKSEDSKVCVWLQIFFYAFAFDIFKRWDPCYSNNAFSGMAITFSLNTTTFSLNAETFSLEWHYSLGPVHCLQNPQTFLFSNFFIKNGSHNTIHTFKNYFATVFSVSAFSFSKNKLNPNRPIVRHNIELMINLVKNIIYASCPNKNFL